jgi:hypothetical protein
MTADASNRYLRAMGTRLADEVMALLLSGNPLIALRVWPFEINDVSGALSAHGYRLRHITDDRDGDKGQNLIYETVWERTA